MSGLPHPSALAPAPAPTHAPTPAPTPTEPVKARGWAGFVQTHLFDYNPRALRLWFLLAACGALSLVGALFQVARLPPADLLQVLLGIALAAVAACFPVGLPRTKYSVTVADVFVFALLALHGAPAAALAAGAEGLVAVLRSSKRLSSRVSTPSAALLAMTLAGWMFEAFVLLFIALDWSSAAARFAALCLAAAPYFAGSMLPLLAVMAAKNKQRLSLRDWAGSYSWLGAIYLLSAAVAGVLAMNAQQFGGAVVLVAAGVAGAVVTLVNVSLRRHEAEHGAQELRIAEAQREAAMNQQRFAASFANAAIGLAIVRPDGSIHQANLALCQLLGRAEGELLGQPFNGLLHPGDVELFQRRVDAFAGQAGDPFSVELRCHGASEQELWVSLHCGRFIDPADNRSGLIYQLHDITSRRRAEDRLHHVAFHDGLTDLANRNCFNESLGMAVERSGLDASKGFAVVFLDLDRFKVVNDSLGHIAGNTLLREVARRLRATVRPDDLVARLGGDEFAILLHRLHQPEDAEAMAERLLHALAVPMLINGTEVVPRASIGVTFSDLGYRTADEVLRDADLAMYAAKAKGRRRVAIFDQSMHERIAEKLALESDLRRAIGEGQLSVVYQPLFDLEPYRLTGFEALARWEHPERGAISPAVFIALAEESGHIEALTAWVVQQAAGQLAHWHAAHPRMAHLGMHVNVCGRDLANTALVPLVRDVLQRTALAPHHLTLEITETTLMSNLAQALDSLQALRKMGVKFSIDDFGTGYSSLAYLSTLPIDSLKIDRSFVMGLSDRPENVEIVRAVLTLGRSLGKKVIAEGIETVQQLATLKEIGVPVGQGYLLARPMRPDQLQGLLQTGLHAEPA